MRKKLLIVVVCVVSENDTKLMEFETVAFSFVKQEK